MGEQLFQVLLGACLAAGISYLANRFLIKYWGNWSIGLLVPGVEEIAKTGLGILLNTSIWGIHILFGVIEALYDGFTGGETRWAAVVASLLGHCFFGFIATSLVSRSMGMAIMVPWLVHGAWNYLTLLLR